MRRIVIPIIINANPEKNELSLNPGNLKAIKLPMMMDEIITIHIKPNEL
jgi:hypothetical protein